MANLAVEVWVRVCVRTWRDKVYFDSLVSACTGFTPAPPIFLAGVETMRARICSAISCDMFARVVWLKLWGVAKLPIFTLFFAARTCHARLARLTRARGRRFLRGWKILLNDFYRAFGHSKAREEEKLLYVFSRVVEGADPL